MKIIEEFFLELVKEDPPLWQLKKGRTPWPTDEKSRFSDPGKETAIAIINLLGLNPMKHDIKWENSFEDQKYGYKVKVFVLEDVDLIPEGIGPEMEEMLMADLPGPKEAPDPGLGEEGGDDPYNLFGKKDDPEDE